MDDYKISKLLNDPAVSHFVTKNWHIFSQQKYKVLNFIVKIRFM